jgi:hypothetical protein
MPHPSSQVNPSKYIAHARTENVAILVLILSAIRSTNACPLTAFAGCTEYQILTARTSISRAGLSTQEPTAYA